MLDYPACLELIRARLREPAPSHVQLLAGARQVGKTTLLLELATDLGPRAIYAAADGPEAALPGFWDRFWNRAETRARPGEPAVVLIDEVQHLHDWGARVKGEWDRLRRRRVPIHVVLTGSSALRIGSGSRESLAGRFERITLSHWSARPTAAVFGLPPEEAAKLVVHSGVFPGAMALRRDPERWAAYVRDAIIEPAIGRDLLTLANVRRPALLRQVFMYAVSSPAQVVTLQKLQGQLQDRGALETIAHYLALLEEAYLIVALQKHGTRPARQRAAPPKLVALNNAYLAALDPRGRPAPETDPVRWGAWVENACAAFAWNSGQHVSYWREEPLEVDVVTDGSWGKWAIEVKTGSFGAHDVRGLFAFTQRFKAYRPLIVCDAAQLPAASRLGSPAMSWTQFLLDGPAGAGT